MKNKKLMTKILALTMVFSTAFSLSGCVNLKSSAKQVGDITEAFKSGDSELFYKSMEQNTKFDNYFDAVENKTDSGLGAVYVKLNEKAQGITIDLDTKNDEYDVPVTISSYDAYTAALDKMYEAALEGPEAFADMPTWLCAALDDAETKTSDIVFDARPDTNSLKYKLSSNKDFINEITCGLYDFMDTTMTTCTDTDFTTCLISKGDDVIFSADYYYIPIAGSELTDDEIQQYINDELAEYDGCEGIMTDFQYDGNLITQMVWVDYNTASTYDLAKLEIISDPNIDGISLDLTIKDFEKDGISCVTDTFGITSDDDKEE